MALPFGAKAILKIKNDYSLSKANKIVSNTSPYCFVSFPEVSKVAKLIYSTNSIGIPDIVHTIKAIFNLASLLLS